MSELFWEPEAARTYERLIHTDAPLVSSVESVLDALAANPGSASTRKFGLRTSSGQAIWRIPIRYRAYDWSLLWITHPTNSEAVLIVYLGPATYDA